MRMANARANSRALLNLANTRCVKSLVNSNADVLALAPPPPPPPPPLPTATNAMASATTRGLPNPTNTRYVRNRVHSELQQRFRRTRQENSAWEQRLHENSGHTEDVRSDAEEKVRQVTNMGFKPLLARRALEAAAMNVHEAVELLGMSQLILTSTASLLLPVAWPATFSDSL